MHSWLKIDESRMKLHATDGHKISILKLAVVLIHTVTNLRGLHLMLLKISYDFLGTDK